MLVTPEKIAAAGAGFRAIYLQSYEDATPDWLDIAMEVESTSESETYNFLTGLPGMKRLIGEAKPEDVALAGFTITNDEWESTITVKRKHIERDSLGIMKPQFAELGTIAREHPAELVADLLNGSFTTKDYTGKNFFDENKKHDP
jgi:phage major head subunit gpT-like protein